MKIPTSLALSHGIDAQSSKIFAEKGQILGHSPKNGVIIPQKMGSSMIFTMKPGCIPKKVVFFWGSSQDHRPYRRTSGQALGDLLSQHPRLARLALHGNALGEKGGAKVFEGLAENARGWDSGFHEPV